MKKLLCISILLIGYSHAQEVPSLATLKSEYAGYNVSPNTTLDFLNYIMFRFNPPGFTGSDKDIEDAIKQWYNEDPKLFRTVGIANNDAAVTIADEFAIEIRIKELLPKNLVPTDRPYRQGAILQVLKQLGLQTLSDQEVNEMAQLLAEKEIAYANVRANRPPIDLSD